MLNLKMEMLIAILTVILIIAGAIAYHQYQIGKAARLREKRQYDLLLLRLEYERTLSSAAAYENKIWQKYLP